MARRPAKTVPRQTYDAARQTADLYQIALHLVIAEKPACTIRAKDPHAGKYEYRLYGPARNVPIVLAIYHHEGQQPQTYAYPWEGWQDMIRRTATRCDDPAWTALSPFQQAITHALDPQYPAAPDAGPGLPGTDTPAGGDPQP